MKLLTVSQRSYLAGFIDGEGCISSRLLRGKNALPRIYTTQKFPIVLRKYHDLTGIGYLHLYGGNWRWSITKCADVKSLLSQLYPFLILKGEQARLAIELCDGALIPEERRMHIHHELKRLKRLESHY